jgi:hypothetical protein
LIISSNFAGCSKGSIDICNTLHYIAIRKENSVWNGS